MRRSWCFSLPFLQSASEGLETWSESWPEPAALFQQGIRFKSGYKSHPLLSGS
jgi:hypothetical protein